MNDTLLLDRTAWDLVLDSAGNMALAEPPYALAQDVASAVKLFITELWYDTSKGIPYFENVLGHLPPASVLIGYMEKAALTVPGVVTVRVILNAITDRNVTGQIQFIDETGVTNNVSF